MVHIAALLMVKNEKKRLRVTLDSVKDTVDSIVVFDTGSTDNTIEILREFSEETGIPLRLKEGDFIDFSTSRNVSLDFAATFDDIDYILSLDVNDELRGGDALRSVAKTYMDKPERGFMVCQQWWANNQITKYYNLRFFRAGQIKSEDLLKSSWEYRGSVHEALYDLKDKEGYQEMLRPQLPEEITIYQDRTQDDDKTSKRFSRDAELLLKDHKDSPKDPRTLFYLAQTYACLNQPDDALYYYKLRTKVEGFQEEKFHAYYEAGRLSQQLGHDWHTCMGWYIKAFEHSQRVEPMMRIAEYYRFLADMQNDLPHDTHEHYMSKNSWLLSFMYSNMACRLEYPSSSLLFVNRLDYDYNRWHHMGIASFYAGCHNEGKIACERAIEAKNEDIDKSNLGHHLRAMGIGASGGTTLTKQQFINAESKRIQDDNPKLSRKQIASKATKMWKDRAKN